MPTAPPDERWATDPKAAPKQVINDCKDQLARASALPVAAAPVQMAAVDPCAGPGAADSVLCWGPWASVAPAAAGFTPDVSQASVPDREICNARTEQCQPLVAEAPPRRHLAVAHLAALDLLRSFPATSSDDPRTLPLPASAASDGSQFTFHRRAVRTSPGYRHGHERHAAERWL
jgi:hypothetical protein